MATLSSTVLTNAACFVTDAGSSKGYQTPHRIVGPTATALEIYGRTGSTFASTYFAYAGGTRIGDWYAG